MEKRLILEKGTGAKMYHKLQKSVFQNTLE